jgi:hypothetical protein
MFDDDGVSDELTDRDLVTVIDRREAVRRVSALLGGVAFVGGSSLLAACQREREKPPAASTPAAPAVQAPIGEFTTQDIALLDEIADTILPTTSTPGAKAAKTGAFMALMVTDTYKAKNRKIFRDGLVTLDAECRKANNLDFMTATPAQRLALLERLDREQKAHTDARTAASKARTRAGATRPAKSSRSADSTEAERFLADQRKTAAVGTETSAAAAVTADTPAHYFRMMKELAMLGYFTSEIGCKQAQRYVESPGRYDPCVPYTPGQKAWAGHA